MSARPLASALPLSIVIILGTLTALAPLSTDMYLPALPQIQADFQATPPQTQSTLAAFLAGFAIGPLFYGPLSDGLGRKIPLYGGLLLFTLASAAILAVSEIHLFAGLRFIQAIGACSGGVIGRAVVRDMVTPQATPRVYATLMLVTGAAPILAPLAGSALVAHFNWQAVFAILTALGVVSLVAVRFTLPESLPSSHRHAPGVIKAARAYGRLLTDRSFLAIALSGAMGMAGLFTYISGSPGVLIGHHHVPVGHFGWFFGANAVGFILAGQIGGRLKGIDRTILLRRAQLAQVAVSVALVVVAATDFGGPLGLTLVLAGFSACLGFIVPTATVLAMAPHGANAGAASALLSMIQFSLGAAASLLVGMAHADSALPLALQMAGCAVLAPLILALGGRDRGAADTPH